MIKVQLSDADRKKVVKYRLEKANRTYQEAVGSIKNGVMSKQLPIVYTMQLTMLFPLYSFLTSMKLALIMAESKCLEKSC